MIKVTVLFGPPQDVEAFEEYYAATHVPLSEKIPNLQRFDRSRVVGTVDGSEPPYHRVADLWFDGMEEMQSALGSAEGQAAAADFQNFATGGVTILVCEV